MRGCRFTLAEVPFREGMEKADIVEHLIRKAEKYVKIREVLFDGGFYEADVIERLEKLKIRYVLRADKGRKLCMDGSQESRNYVGGILCPEENRQDAGVACVGYKHGCVTEEDTENL
ncbi:MAG: hypothetical protein B6U72_05350 [Candidatus Altiarchaeales archaeon ex4484_2]|nr:MAG: hypothetical protein B6U72_05350 [Candidatus Altiarchaeales archaeon ex4484_2]